MAQCEEEPAPVYRAICDEIGEHVPQIIKKTSDLTQNPSFYKKLGSLCCYKYYFHSVQVMLCETLVSDARIKQEPLGEEERDQACTSVWRVQAALEPGAARMEDLYAIYAGHQVKEELVIGPEVLQPPDTESTTLLHNGMIKNDSNDNYLKFSCNSCEKIFNSKISLLLHQSLHTGKKVHTCHMCDKKYTSKSNLKCHLVVDHGSKKLLTCDICEKNFTNRTTLIRHLHVHSGEKRYACGICSKKFMDGSNLSRHLRTHSGEKPFVCNICKKQFKDRTNLRCHLCVHSGEQPFQCLICYKKFTAKSNLRFHLRIHSGEKPFACHACNMKFTSRWKLTRHIHIHRVEKPFKCDTCRKQYKKKSSLKHHRCVLGGDK